MAGEKIIFIKKILKKFKKIIPNRSEIQNFDRKSHNFSSEVRKNRSRSPRRPSASLPAVRSALRPSRRRPSLRPPRRKCRQSLRLKNKYYESKKNSILIESARILFRGQKIYIHRCRLPPKHFFRATILIFQFNF